VNIIYETTKERGATILMPTAMVDSMNPVVAFALAGQTQSVITRSRLRRPTLGNAEPSGTTAVLSKGRFEMRQFSLAHPKGLVRSQTDETNIRRVVWSRRSLLGTLTSGVATALIAPGLARAKPTPDKGLQSANVLQSAGALTFGPDNVLFVGDTKGASIHAFELRASDYTSQQHVGLGDARTFKGRDLISSIDRQLAALLGTSSEQVQINDMKVHRPSRQIFLSVHRGRGPDAVPLIVKVNAGKLEVLELGTLRHTVTRIQDAPDGETLEFGQSERSLTITDITFYNDELIVSGLSNEEFSSVLRRIPYPFDGQISTSSVEIWHAVHAEFETRAPIIQQLVHELNGVPYLIAVYTCTPLVRFPLAGLKNGAHMLGETIGEIGFGNTPIDMVAFVDPSDKKENILITNADRSAVRIAISDITNAKPLPVNAPHNFGPAGVSQYPLPMTAVQQLDLIEDQWAAVIRINPNDYRRLDLHTFAVPYFFDRADDVVEMNFPGGPDPFGYHGKPKPENRSGIAL
jgi:hypothetical protein